MYDADMRQVRDRVTLHPETVAKAESMVPKRRRKARQEPDVTRRYKKKPPSLNPDVWNTALSLASGDYKRLVVESDDCILVKNK